MDRLIIYSQQQARSFDILSFCKDIIRGHGHLATALFGNNNQFVHGFSAAAQGVPNLTLNLAFGQIYHYTTFDGTAYGSVGADASFIYQQGYADAQVLTFTTAGLSAGQSRWVMVQCRFLQQDVVRTGDPTGGLLAYYNSANPAVPLQGPADSGSTQPTQRKGVAEITLNYGTPATTGSQVAPTPAAGFVGLYLVLLTFGQTAITNGQILKCAPNIGDGTSGVAYAPFIEGLLGQHHTGIGSGGGSKIDLTNSVVNKLPLANCYASNTVGTMTCLRMGAADPNGSVTGKIGDTYYASTPNRWYVCTVDNTNNNWAAVGGGPQVVASNTFPFDLTNQFSTHFFDVTAGNGTVNLPAISAAGPNCQITCAKEDSSVNKVIVTPAGGDTIQDGIANSASLELLLQGDSVTLVPRGTKWFVV